MDKHKFSETLEKIAQMKVSLSEMETKEVKFVEEIRAVERGLHKLRFEKRKLEMQMMNLCDKLFHDVWAILPEEINNVKKDS